MVMMRGVFTHPGCQTLVRIPFDLTTSSQCFDDLGDSVSKSCTDLHVSVLMAYTSKHDHPCPYCILSEKNYVGHDHCCSYCTLIARCGRDLFFPVHINVELFCGYFIEEPKYTVDCSVTLKNDLLSTIS